MRVALWASSLGHAAIIGWAVFAFPGSDHMVAPPAPLPVDIVSIEEFTQVTAGIREAEPEAEPEAPETTAEAPPSEQPVPEPEPAQEQSAAPEPIPEARPEPEPEPELDLSELRTASLPEEAPAPEPRPEPEPAPAAEAEPEPAPMPTDVPLPRARPEVAEQPRPEPAPAPEPQRSPPPQPDDRSFDADRIAALLNRIPDSGGAVQSDAIGDMLSHGAPTASDHSLSMSEIDALRRQIAQCWNPPVGVLEAGELVVRLDLQLNRDGSLARPPQVINTSPNAIFTVAAEAATRAVSRCQPYNLPADKYDLWQHIHVNFDPREMMGG